MNQILLWNCADMGGIINECQIQTGHLCFDLFCDEEHVIGQLFPRSVILIGVPR